MREALPPGVHREPQHQAPRLGKRRWAIESAYRRHLLGHSELQIADSLDLTDHLNRVTGSRKRESRSVRRYVKEGRKTLATLGAWPWAVEKDGRLDVRGWWRDDRFAAALFAWHEEAFVMAYNDTLLSADNITGRERYRTDGDRLSAGCDLHRERLRRRLAEKADAA